MSGVEEMGVELKKMGQPKSMSLFHNGQVCYIKGTAQQDGSGQK